MSTPLTQSDLDRVLSKVDERFEEVVGLLNAFMTQTSTQFEGVNQQFDKMDQRFDKMDQRFDVFETSVNARFDAVDVRLDTLDKKYDHLISTLDTFLGRLDHYEVEQAARDSQMQRLLDWAQKVSQKTGIPLEI